MSDSIKLVVSDLDGTLVRAGGWISNYDKSALQFLHQSRIPLVLASGRTLYDMKEIVKRSTTQLTDYDFLIAKNGALIYNCRQKKAIVEQIFAESLAKKIILTAQKYRLVVLGFGRSGTTQVVYSSALISLRVLSWKLVRGRGRQLIRFNNHRPLTNITKFLITGKKSRVLKFYADFLCYEKLACYKTVFPILKVVLDLAPFATSKKLAIAKICQIKKITSDQVMFIGDGHNDISALRWVGVGVAMGNAAPDVKSSATKTTHSITESGFARAIARQFPNFRI